MRDFGRSVSYDELHDQIARERDEASKCTVWCSVLSDEGQERSPHLRDRVLMRLMALAAF